MAIDFEKLKTKAAQKDAATYAAQKADFAKVKHRVSAPVANNAKNKAIAAQIKANPSMLTAKITPITMAQTAAGVAKGNIPNAFQNQKESGFERVADTIGAGTSSLVGGAANAMRLATTGKYSPTGIISRGIDKIRGTNYTAQNAANQQSFVDKMMDQSKLSTEYAKRGISKAGQAGVDIGSAATQIGLMALTGGVAGSLGAGGEATGALTKGLMAIQQAGQGAYDAEKRGADEGTQALYGLLQGATAYATEGISNVGALGKVFGNGAVDSKLEQASANAISKFIKSKTGRAIANRLATGVEAGLGEALEQNIQDALTPVYQRLTYDKNAKLNAEDMIYNGLVAGAVGGIVGSAGKNNLKALETENAPKTQQRAPETKTNIFPENSIGAKITTPLKTGGNTASVQNVQSNELGAANSGFDPYSHLQNKYGNIQPGENPTRVVDVPLKTSDDMNVSRGVRTALEAKATPDEAVGPIQDAVTAERFSFETIKDKDAAARAEATVSQKGYETALRDWTADARSGKVSKDLMAQGQVLYNNAVNAGDYKTGVDILTDYVKMSRNGAQATQANRMLKKLDPQYQLYALERQSQHISEELAAKFKKSGFDGIKLNEDLVRQFHEAKTQEARDAVMDKLKDDVASQIPSSWKDKWDAWRYLSMLGNPRTHIRNIAGNAGFVPVREVKNIIGAGIEKATGSDRTKSVLTMKDHNLVKYALNDYAEVADSVMKNGKFNDLASDLNERRQIFKNRGLEALRKGNSKALDAEDVWFAKNAYARSLAGYYKANGITAEALSDGSVPQATIDKARAYAIKEAQKATYRDSNAFSDWISRIGKYHGDNKWAKAGSTAVDAILPFRRTPANILARAWEYSPGEFLNVLGGDIRKVWSGNMDASEMIDHISSGMTGTMLLGLGAYLASQGLLTGGKSDDDDEAALATQQGYQDYALNIGGKSITLDWLAPEALPLFTGAEIFKTMQQKSDGKVTLEKALTNFGNMAEPMIDMSMLQGVNDLIDSVKYSKGNSILSIAATTAANYLSQGLPTLAGQLERVGEKERETTYVDKTSGIPTALQYMLGKAANKIPGIEYQQRPYTDMFGQHESSGSVGERVVNNLFNPAYVRDIKQDGVTDELSRLVNGKYMSGVPDLPDQKITYGGKDNNLNKDEYTKYAEKVGQLEHKYAASMINNRVYSSMTDEQKADYLKTIISYAKDEAKRDYINKNGGKYESQMDGVYNAQQAGIEPDDFYAYKKYLKDIDPDGGNATQLQKTKAIDKTDLTTQMKGKLWQLQNSTSNPEKNPYTGTLAQLGLAPSKTIEIMEAFSTIDDAVKNNYVKADKGPSAAQVKAAYLIQWLTRQGYNANQRAAITDVFTTWQMIPIDKPSKKATAFVNANPMP